MKIALFPGSFDPFTKGHEDIVLRSLSIFDKVVIGIGINSTKNRLFNVEIMKACISDTFQNYPQVEIMLYQGLTAEFARKIDAKFLIRGLRNTTDFEYENSISQGNKMLNNSLETVFLITSPHLAYISSTIAREIIRLGGDASAFLPYDIKMLTEL